MKLLPRLNVCIGRLRPFQVQPEGSVVDGSDSTALLVGDQAQGSGDHSRLRTALSVDLCALDPHAASVSGDQQEHDVPHDLHAVDAPWGHGEHRHVDARAVLLTGEAVDALDHGPKFAYQQGSSYQVPANFFSWPIPKISQSSSLWWKELSIKKILSQCFMTQGI